MSTVKLGPGHVTDAQIQEYLRNNAGEGDEELQRIGRHLSKCENCLELALQAQREQLGFLNAIRADAIRQSRCPDEETIRSLAAGYLIEGVPELLHHVVHCNFCGLLLQRFREEFSEDLSAEGADLLEHVESSSQRWQKNFVRSHLPIRPTPTIWKRLSSLIAGHAPIRRRWAIIVASALGMLVLAVIEEPAIADKLQQKKAIGLALRAASEKPTVEMRIPNARYAPYQKQLGPSASDNPDLLEAQSIVGRKKMSGRLDRSWLALEGLTSLLEGTPDGASRASIAFEKALAEGLDDPSVQIELAASYFESERADVLKAIELLETVLKRPKLSVENREVALYNVALAYESIQDWQAAVTRWDDYLKLDSSSEWAREAKTRRDNDRAKVPSPHARDPNPSSFLRTPALQPLVEEYQEIALRFWLTKAVLKPHSEAALASRKLADLLDSEPHSDPFLKDLIASSSPRQLQALSDLSAAIAANKTGFYHTAAEKARNAALIFEQHHNTAGKLRARFEDVFAAQQAVAGDDCVPRARSLRAELRSTKFKWLQAASALELATCLNLAGDLARSEEELIASKTIVEQSGFPVLGLRILGVGAGIHRLQNNRAEAWNEAIEGLRSINAGAYPADRLYQFYSVMEQWAEQEHSLHAQRTFLLQAIALQENSNLRGDENLILKGALYGRLSRLYLSLEEDGLATEASMRSDQYLLQAPDEPYVNIYVAYVKVGLAEAQLQLGDPSMALATLEPARGRMAGISDQFISLDFYRVLGASYRYLNRYADAAGAYQDGLVLAEKALATVADERNRLKWINGVDPIYRGLTLALLQQGKDRDAYKLWEWYGSRALQTKSSTREISWNILQKTMSNPLPRFSSGTRLVYAVFEDRLQIWTRNEEMIKGRDIKIRESELVMKVNDFALQCATPPPSDPAAAAVLEKELRKTSLALWALFLEPVVSELKPSQVVAVELDPRISRLPVAALLSSNDRYFGQDYMTFNSPGLYQDQNAREIEFTVTQSAVLLVFGSARELPGQKQLKQIILRTFPRVSVMNADQNSWNEVTRGLHHSKVFIFVGHGIRHGDESSLLYGKSRLRAQDFPPKVVGRLRLVILEACSSGAEGGHSLQETASLVHSFLAAGVPVMIASRWDVDSAVTAKLLSIFLNALSSSEAVPKAMYRARNAILRENRQPYYWAGIEAFGKGQ